KHEIGNCEKRRIEWQKKYLNVDVIKIWSEEEAPAMEHLLPSPLK
ncbi:22345_t:CDS:1, partial [Gigaspora rosea]